MDESERGTSVPVIRMIAAALMVLPLFAGLGTAALPGDLLYPRGGSEELATARVGALISASSLAVFWGMEIMPGDPRRGARMVLAATLVAGGVGLAHDTAVGWGLFLVMIFFVPAALYALPRLFAAPATASTPLVTRVRRRVSAVAWLFGFAAAYYWSEAATRGLSIDVGMLIGGVSTAIALAVCVVCALRYADENTTVATLVALVVGLIGMREYFIAQAALLGAAAYLSLGASTAVRASRAETSPSA